MKKQIGLFAYQPTQYWFTRRSPIP